MTKIAYQILLDRQSDAWNWYDACNSISHGMNWSERAPKEYLKSIKGKTKKQAMKITDDYLKKLYVKEKTKIDDSKKLFAAIYDKRLNKACKKLEEVIGKPIYTDSFKIYLTTFPRAPYSYNEAYLFMCVDWKGPISVFLHELSHFQFIHYWRNNPESSVSKLTKDQFEWIKESLTIILDDDFKPLIEFNDRGYEIHQSFRKKLTEFWKTNHNFDELVDYGVKILPRYVK